LLSHTLVGTNDMPRAIAFYDEVLGLLGAKQMMSYPTAVGWGVSAPQFAVCTPHDKQPATVGNGTMIALMAPTRALVAEVHAKAVSLGGKDEGEPGIRGDDPNGFYGAYFRDLDGNKLCIYRMGPPDAA